ncbi:MAG TPA: DUF2062 domain-containing protein [Rhodospirillales bacterium]|nr:DUF2062 domain-containing protein [Rhodospirillales bacterium]HJO68599.1 DUF2062 domain-containing protein [Rhodospirillales bacterium]
MVLGRRSKQPWTLRFREFLWPRMGWRRSTEYLRHRLARLHATPHEIAAGFACGAAIAVTPFVGTHLVVAAALAWLIRGNIIASAIGSLLGNPWTFPFIWIWTFELGRWMGFDGNVSTDKVDFVTFFGAMLKAALRFDVRFMFESVWPVLGPMLAGSVPTAIAIWLAIYFPIRSLVASYRSRREIRRLRKERTLLKETLG